MIFTTVWIPSRADETKMDQGANRLNASFTIFPKPDNRGILLNSKHWSDICHVHYTGSSRFQQGWWIPGCACRLIPEIMVATRRCPAVSSTSIIFLDLCSVVSRRWLMTTWWHEEKCIKVNTCLTLIVSLLAAMMSIPWQSMLTKTGISWMISRYEIIYTRFLKIYCLLLKKV